MQVGFPRLISAAYAISAPFLDFGGFNHHSVTMQEKASRSAVLKAARFCARAIAAATVTGRRSTQDRAEEKWLRFLFLVDFSPPNLLVPLAFLAQVLVRAGTSVRIGSALEEALRSVS